MGIVVTIGSLLYSILVTLRGYYAVEKVLVAMSLFMFIMQSVFMLLLDNADGQLRYRLISITISLVTIMCLINTTV